MGARGKGRLPFFKAGRQEDSRPRAFAPPAEFLGAVHGFDWLAQVNLRLPDGLAGAGDVWVSVTLRGGTSNSVLVRAGP